MNIGISRFSFLKDSQKKQIRTTFGKPDVYL